MIHDLLGTGSGIRRDHVEHNMRMHCSKCESLRFSPKEIHKKNYIFIRLIKAILIAFIHKELLFLNYVCTTYRIAQSMKCFVYAK